MSELLGRTVYPARGWELLQRWEHRLKVPRPEHVKRDKQAGEVFKKIKIVLIPLLAQTCLP